MNSISSVLRMTTNKELQGFKVLPLKFSSKITEHHELFIKEHSIHKVDANRPNGCTLFVANIPPYATEESFGRIFSKAGVIDLVEFVESKEHGFKWGYIVFNKPTGLSKALKLKHLDPLSTDEQPVSVGLRKWIQEHNNSILDHNTLQKEIDAFMEEYDANEEEQKQNEREQKEDDEGWTLVTKKGRNPGVSRKESVENKIIQKINRKSKKKELKNFYTFQIRESKMNHIVKLRQKFEEDKKRIETFKKTRRFKPF